MMELKDLRPMIEEGLELDGGMEVASLGVTEVVRSRPLDISWLLLSLPGKSRDDEDLARAPPGTSRAAPADCVRERVSESAPSAAWPLSRLGLIQDILSSELRAPSLLFTRSSIVSVAVAVAKANSTHLGCT